MAKERSAISPRSATATWLSGAVLGQERAKERGSREKFPNHPHHNLGCSVLRHSESHLSSYFKLKGGLQSKLNLVGQVVGELPCF